jgi:nucleoid DNA-binding protein
VVHRLLANPTVTFDGHSGVLPFVNNRFIYQQYELREGNLHLPGQKILSSISFFILRQRSAVDNHVSTFYHLLNTQVFVFQLLKTKITAQGWRPKMIKQDLIQRVVERTGLPRTKAEDAVDAIFDSMKQSLVAGDRIELRGFGVFTVKPRKTGIGRNPRTGAEVTIAPGKAVRFKPGKELHLLQ